MSRREGQGWEKGREGKRERKKEEEREFLTIDPSDLVISIILMLRS